MGYIPRPPNAFMLFRADFVRQKHVPGSIETNHGSLSKIIGNCWRSLPLEEKRVWEVKAKQAKAAHKLQYPEYRFRPVHNKNKDKKKEKPATTIEDERRCEEVAQLLLEGKKGDELAAAVRHLDHARASPPPAYQYRHRRSSSVPLPNDWHPLIAIPSLPFLTLSRPESPVNNISRGNRAALGHRRASSARPAGSRAWTLPVPTTLQRDDSPLPEADTSLFEESFLNASGFPSFSAHSHDLTQYGFGDMMQGMHMGSPQDLQLGPLDTVAPHTLTYTQHNPNNHPQLDPMTWLPIDTMYNAVQPQSHTSSAYSGSPAPSDHSLPVHAPQPQLALPPNAAPFADAAWKDFSVDQMQMQPQQQQSHQQMQHTDLVHAFEHGLDFTQSQCGAPNGDYSSGLESIFNPSYDMNFGFDFNNDMIQS
jgi:hypothetical protein